jgi:predicted RNA-binding protein with PIN domain
MSVIIDGYNLLRSIQKSDEQAELTNEIQLCRVVGRYLKITGQTGEIIFDGTGPSGKFEFEDISNLETFFVGLSTDADTVIENKIQASTAPKQLTIVSSDRRLRDAARKRKATLVKSQVFWNKLQRQLSRKSKIKEPAAKRLGLTESETKQWLKFFDLEQ